MENSGAQRLNGLETPDEEPYRWGGLSSFARGGRAGTRKRHLAWRRSGRPDAMRHLWQVLATTTIATSAINKDHDDHDDESAAARTHQVGLERANCLRRIDQSAT